MAHPRRRLLCEAPHEWFVAGLLGDRGRTVPLRTYAAEFYGGTMNDVVAYTPYLGRWWVAANRTGYFSQQDGPATGASWISSWATEDASTTWQTMVADVSGDGYADLIAYTPQLGRWFVAYNWGDRFTGASGPYTNGSWLDSWGINNTAPAPRRATPSTPSVLVLAPNVPNPFNPITTIRYTLPQDGMVRLTVHDVRGRRVVTLVAECQKAGEHSVAWNATGLASGLYLCTLDASGGKATRKLMLMK